MRSVTPHLNEKLTSTQQTPANKADPKMSIRVSRARTTVMDSDYWTVETIRTADNLGDISLAARRRVPYGSPDSIYEIHICLLYTSPSPRDRQKSRMPSSA